VDEVKQSGIDMNDYTVLIIKIMIDAISITNLVPRIFIHVTTHN